MKKVLRVLDSVINDLNKGELAKINPPISNNLKLTEYLVGNKNKINNKVNNVELKDVKASSDGKETVTLKDHCALDIKVYVKKTVKLEYVIGSIYGE